MLPKVTNGIFAETLDLLCGKCFNLSKSVSARSSSYHFGMNLCVCMCEKTCLIQRCCQHRLYDWTGLLAFLVMSIEHTFAFVNSVFECMFCFCVVIFTNGICMGELYEILCVVKCDVKWTHCMKKLPPGINGMLVGSFIFVAMKLVFYF